MFRYWTSRVINQLSTRSASSFVNVSVDNEGIALMSILRPPVNSLNLTVMQELCDALDALDKDGSKGLIITSGLQKVFSAGLDLNEIVKPDPKRVRMFAKSLQDVFFKLYGSSFTTAAAINGHAAAGACVLSVMCDYRVMVDGPSKIGFNDTVVGVVPRPWICQLFVNTMGYREAEIAITSSTMYTAEQALKVNLIDELAADKEDAIERCKQFIRRYDDIALPVRALAKRRMREHALNAARQHAQEDVELMAQHVTHPDTQARIDAYFKKIKKNRK